ncbi:cyclase family protein [Arthrobacter sp. GCM10027362]|uniref:cyclase family protein n=1 Tax=Arthrobacter sp. GCM10027362 TaxID=3273379 RepID=UPI00362720D8
MTTNPVVSLLATLSQAALYDLEQPRYAGAPIFTAHRPGFLYTLHRRHEAGLGEARTSASGLIITAEHSGTHIDALCHQASDLQMFGGRRVDAQVQTSTGFSELGVETIGPMIARGVLIDVARHRGVDRLPAGAVVGADELEAAATAQNVSVASGDVVLVRTGSGSRWHDPDEYLRGAGISAEASEWLAGHQVQAVGADNVAWDSVEADPQRGSLPGHVVLIVQNGIYILENLQLEELAASGNQEFLFVCLPLKMVGVTGSPVRPLAVVPV